MASTETAQDAGRAVDLQAATEVTAATSDPVYVHTVLREPLELTLRFVAWHLDLGVDQICLYFDDPDDPAVTLLDGHPRVQCHRCTPEFWSEVGVRPEARFTLRQKAALTCGYRRQEQGWALILDSDEYLHLRDGTLPGLLKTFGGGVKSLRILPAEPLALRDADPARIEPDAAAGQWYRLKMPVEVVNRIYRRDAMMLRKRGGMNGHSFGKSLIRAGLPLTSVQQHGPDHAEGEDAGERVLGPAEGAVLLHHFDSGYERWRAKLDWRIESWGVGRRFAARVRDLAKTPESYEAELAELYKRLYTMTPKQLAILKQAGCALHLAVDVDAPRRRLFPPET